MAHWRDGGIGNMAGSDDRPIEEWTLLEKLADIASAPIGSIDRPYVMRARGDWATPLKQIAQEAFDEIQRLREGWGLAGFPTWQPISTAPVPPREELLHGRWRCMLQDKHGTVLSGYAAYVVARKGPDPGRKHRAASESYRLQWYADPGRYQVGPVFAAKYWMPLPAPHCEPTSEGKPEKLS